MISDSCNPKVIEEVNRNRPFLHTKVTHHLINILQALLPAKTLPAYWRYVWYTGN